MKNSILLILLLSIIINSNTLFAQQYADTVVIAQLGGKNNAAVNLESVEGEPQYSWNSNTFISLGGGFITIDLGVNVINGEGPDLRIYEVGEESYSATSEPFYALGNKENTTTNWVFLGSFLGDIVEIDFDTLGIDTLRFLTIYDTDPKTPDDFQWPGADIDAVETLNFTTLSSKQVFMNNIVKDFNLNQNYPNPFNPSTKISYDLSNSAHVVLIIYNSLGQKIKTLKNETQKIGTHTISWDGTDEIGNRISSGKYFYQLRVDGEVQSKQMIFLK
jgi:hypothetical protein